MRVAGLVRSLDSRVRELRRHLELVDTACRQKAITLGHDPVEVTLEITTYCNIRCTMCAISWDPRFDPKADTSGHMRLETVQALEPILPHVVRWYLMGVGEPLINPAFLDIVELVKSFGAQAQFNTNATKLSTTLSERFIDLGVNTSAPSRGPRCSSPGTVQSGRAAGARSRSVTSEPRRSPTSGTVSPTGRSGRCSRKAQSQRCARTVCATGACDTPCPS